MPYIPSCKDEELFLKNYDASKYQNPAVAADTALFALDGGAVRILLIKRGGYPYKGCWALPGGFVNIDEDILDSAKRELFEETGIKDVYMEQAFVWGSVDRDPRARAITVSYIALADYSKLCAKAGDDAADAKWFSIDSYTKKEQDGITEISYTLSGSEILLPIVTYPTGRIQQISRKQSGGLAFDHAESIAYSFECLKSRMRNEQFLEFALSDSDMRTRTKKAIFNI